MGKEAMAWEGGIYAQMAGLPVGYQAWPLATADL